jgi:leader peptidase (prepilin peptidase)/N-methyltransferase
VTRVDLFLALLFFSLGMLSGTSVQAAAIRFGDGKRRAPLFVSFLAGVLFTLAYLQRRGDWLELAVALLLIAFCLLLSITDLLCLRVPNLVLCRFLPLFLILRFFSRPDLWNSHLIAGACAFLLFFGIALMWPGAIGMGDVKLVGVIGFVLGWRPLMAGLLLSSLIAWLAAAAMLAANRTERGIAMPFVPSLSAGCLAAYFFVQPP